MSIPHAFNPLGRSGEKSITLLASDFKASTWSAEELVPVGLPNNGISTRGCSRNEEQNIVVFAFANGATLAQAVNAWNYYYNVPPRSTKTLTSPAIELDLLSAPRKVVFKFRLCKLTNLKPDGILSSSVQVAYSNDEWGTWKEKDCSLEGEIFTAETDLCSSLVIKCRKTGLMIFFIESVTLF